MPVLVSLLLFLLLSRLWRLGVPDTYYFDEVYHAFTAQAYADNNPSGYEWWHKAPEGFAYEWLHPPLAKLLQAASINLLGNEPFSWRLPGVLFGVGVGVLLYLLGRNVFKSPRIGLLALAFWTFDGLSLTMSRITMNDIFLAFWILLAFYLFFLKKPLWMAGIALGLALATKWSAVFAIILLLFFWLKHNCKKLDLKKLAVAGYSFLLIPLIIYLLSYTQFFLQGHSWGQFVELHRQTWWYQTNLEAIHPYSSTALEWPLGIKPLYAYTDGESRNIYFAGNPVLWWGGLAAVVFLLAKARKLSFEIRAVLLAYLLMFLPWAFSPRIMFIYHYLPALPFLFLILSWSLERLWEGKRLLVIGYLLLSATAFLVYYPVWTAISVPQWWPRF